MIRNNDLNVKHQPDSVEDLEFDLKESVGDARKGSDRMAKWAKEDKPRFLKRAAALGLNGREMLEKAWK